MPINKNYNKIALKALVILSSYAFSLPLTAEHHPYRTYMNRAHDLEAMSQDFVLETKRIQIPEHPSAFNPSIVRWQNRLLMSFREIDDSIHTQHNDDVLANNGYSTIGLIWLDDDFSPIGKPQILQANTRIEDPRLVIVGDKLFAVYADTHANDISERGIRRMYVAELEYDGQNFSLDTPYCMTNFEGEDPSRHEKNWVPFDYEGELLLSYSINPHRVLQPLFDEDSCQTAANSWCYINWKWGELRGGTPAIAIDDNRYLGFFHSIREMASLQSNGVSMPHYFIGAYTFNKDAPFTLTHVSPEPIIGKDFYNGNVYKPYWQPVRVVFPCGYICDEHHIWLTYGRQDHEIWVAKLDKTALLDSLCPVENREGDPEKCMEEELRETIDRLKDLSDCIESLQNKEIQKFTQSIADTQSKIDLVQNKLLENKSEIWGFLAAHLDSDNMFLKAIDGLLQLLFPSYSKARQERKLLKKELKQFQHEQSNLQMQLLSLQTLLTHKRCELEATAEKMSALYSQMESKNSSMSY